MASVERLPVALEEVLPGPLAGSLRRRLIANTDAHAKNYSVLLMAGEARLAPLYDVASLLPYPEYSLRKVRLAMKVGGKYRIAEIAKHHWVKQVAEMRVPEGQLLQQLRELLTAAPDESATTLRGCRDARLDEPVLQRLHDELTKRVAILKEQFGF